jgi:hypothetical protein
MLISLITFYQKFVSPALKQLLGLQNMCRFSPSCSEYTKVSIKKYGTIKGLSLGLVQLLHCQPFAVQKNCHPGTSS